MSLLSFSKLKKIFFFLILFGVFLLVLFLARENKKFCWATDRRNCGEAKTPNLFSLPVAPAIIPSPFLMLLEGYYNDFLSPRMLCTVESTAVAHPNITVYVLMTSDKLQMTPITLSVMEKYSNIKFVHFNSSSLLLNSPLQKWFTNRKWEEGKFPQEHFNDALRWALLWKHGGIYLDMDIIVMRNLIRKYNFAGLESEKWIGAGALGFTKRHPVIEECIRKMTIKYDGSVWGSAGPELITSIMQEYCGMELPTRNLKECQDIKVYPPKTFYPIPWWNWKKFLEQNTELTEQLLNDEEILGLHVWNLHTQKYPVNLYDYNPFAMAASIYCPIVVYEVGYQL